MTIKAVTTEMKAKAFRFVVGSLFFASFFASASASAQVRNYVASTGLDINPCSRTAPCRTFQAAVNVVQPGGEVVALDSTEYGPIHITKAVSVVAAPGIQAAVTVTSGNGLTINAGPSDIVTLRGLTITGVGGSAGVYFNAGRALSIESCLISGFSGFPTNTEYGVFFAGGGDLAVTDSSVRHNDIGVLVMPAAGNAFAALDHVRIEDGIGGLVVRDGSKVSVRDSVASANLVGLNAASSTTPVELTVDNCMVSNNSADGISASSPSGASVTVRVSSSTVTDNSTGLANHGGALLLSRDSNTVEGNSNNTLGVIGSYPAK